MYKIFKKRSLIIIFFHELRGTRTLYVCGGWQMAKYELQSAACFKQNEG
jgi:hypothetical protein